MVPGFLIRSFSDHYNSLGRLAEYKRQFQRVVRRPGDDPSIFAIELETLARMAFIDIDISIQILMVRDRFIDGQVECALRRYLDSLEPNTPMSDIVDCCQLWESHRDVETEPRTSADRRPARAVCQVTVGEQKPTASPETETLENIIRRLLPTPVPPAARDDPIPSDRDLLISPAIIGNNSPIEASCTGTIGSNGIGNTVTKLAPSRNNHRRKCGVAESINSFSRGMFFMRSIGPYDGKLPDS